MCPRVSEIKTYGLANKRPVQQWIRHFDSSNPSETCTQLPLRDVGFAVMSATRCFLWGAAAGPYSQRCLFLFRLDPDRPQREALWQHPVLPSRWQSCLTQRSTGCPGAAGRGKAFPCPGPSGALPKLPAGQFHPNWLTHSLLLFRLQSFSIQKWNTGTTFECQTVI